MPVSMSFIGVHSAAAGSVEPGSFLRIRSERR
jgi:hypothetical protein